MSSLSKSSLVGGLVSGWTIAFIFLLVFGLLLYLYLRLRRKYRLTTTVPATAPAGVEETTEIPVAHTVLGDPEIHAHNIFSYEELSKATSEFSQDRIIGEGGFGLVYRGVLEDGREVAVKRLKVGSRQVDQFETELKLVIHLQQNDNIIRIYGCCIHGQERCIVYSLADQRSLESHLKDEEINELNWERRYGIALGVARAIEFLHSDNCKPVILHRDIKSSNILLDRDFRAKLADFGIAKISEEAFTHLSTEAKGTVGYMDPSYSQTGKLTLESDVFSFGIVLLELITGRNPTDKKRTFPVGVAMVHWATHLIKQGLEDKNFGELVDERLEHYDAQQMREMMTCALLCVRMNPADRPKMSQIVQVLEGNMSAREIAGASGIWSEDEVDAQKLRSMAFGGQSSQVKRVEGLVS